MDLSISRNMSQDHLEELKNKAIDWALANGISLRPSAQDGDQNKTVYAPFTLFPTTVSYPILQQARQSMVHFNTLMHRVSMDHAFLQDVFKNVIQVDDFTRRLWNIFLTVKDDPLTQPIYLGSFRNDYMIQIEDGNKQRLKQIEFNTIAAGLCGLGSKLPEMYRYILNCAGISYEDHQIPQTDIAKFHATAFVKAWEIYGNPRAVILFLVLHNEFNVMDQRLLEFEIYKQNPNIRVIRKTLDDLVRFGQLTEDRRYTIDGEEVGLVYYRTGYCPEQYTSEKIWQVRLELEQGKCIKCPPINYQLVGAKKIQQVLAEPGVLERFIKDRQVLDMIQSTFAGQYTLDIGDDGNKAIEMAIQWPEKFVLKPQREGGGNNLYGNEMKDFLESIRESEERFALILMDLIKPIKSLNYIVKPTLSFEPRECVTELGIFGCYIGTKSGEVLNIETGCILRSKSASVKEGGLSAGFGGLDYPFIIDV